MTDHKFTAAELTELAAVLETSEKNAPARAAALRLFPACGRCGGSGHYSFNQMNGTTCFGCGGSGQRFARRNEGAAVIERAQACVAAGDLARYIVYLEARNAAKGATSRVMAAWTATGISKRYSWMKAAKGIQPDRAFADINSRMADAHTRVTDASFALHGKGDRREATVKLAAELTAALDEIADADVALRELLAYLNIGC